MTRLLSLSFSLLSVLLLSLLLVIPSVDCLTSSAAQSGSIDFHLQRIGIPINQHSRVQQRFHRIQRQGQDPNDREGHKGQTAIYTAGRAKGGVNTITALNPRNGGVVWRQVLEPSDPIQAFFTTSDVILTLSGPTASNVRLHHALTGHLLWEAAASSPSTSNSNSTSLISEDSKTESELGLGFDAHLMRGVGDALVISNGNLLRRLEAKTGKEVFKYEVTTESSSEKEQLIRVVSTHSNIFAVSIRQITKGLISRETHWKLKVQVLSLGGKALNSFDLESEIQNGSSDVILSPLSSSTQFNEEQHSSSGGASGIKAPLAPHLVWLQKDGSIRFLPLHYNEKLSESDLNSKIQVLIPKDQTKFVEVQEILGSAVHRGLIVGVKNDGRAEFIKIVNAQKGLKEIDSEAVSAFQTEEEALDAVHSGFEDKSGRAFVSRVFFTRNQHLLNIHVFWVDADGGQGQVSGYSFQWDHDLNGNVLSSSFEVSMISAYQIVTRASLTTSSGSIRLIQEDQHQWILEESLSDLKGNLLVDLPEKKLSGLTLGSYGRNLTGSEDSTVNAPLGKEFFHQRIFRHVSYLQDFPSYLQSLLSSTSQISSYKDIFTKTFSAQRETLPPKPAGEPATPLRPPPPPPGTKKVPQHKSETGGSHSALAPRFWNSTYNNLERDDFGFKKLLISSTVTGKLFAQDMGERGKFVWEKSLIGFGQGQGSPEPKIKILSMWQTRSLGEASEINDEEEKFGSSAVEVKVGGEEADDSKPPVVNRKASNSAPIVTILAEQTILKGAPVTSIFELDPITGNFVDDAQTGIPFFIGRAKDVFLLPVRDAESALRVVAAVDKDDKIHIHPASSSVISALNQISNDFYYSLETVSSDGSSVLTGYSTIGNGLTNGEPATKVWSHIFASGEKILSTQNFNRDTIASLGKVKGDRSTFYKYLNPHSKVVVTIKDEVSSEITGKEGAVYLLDGVSGRVLWETKFHDVVEENGIKVNFVENWITVAYSNTNENEGLSNRLLSVELYDRDMENQIWNWKGFFSSFGKVTNSKIQTSKKEKNLQGVERSFEEEEEDLPSILPISYSQTFILPYVVHSLGTTSTKFGITSKVLLLSNHLDQLISIPRRFLDPRRVVGRKPTTQEMEEMLIPYDPLIPNEPKWIVSHFYSVSNVAQIKSSPALLESTSLVLATGLDTFWTRVTPSNTFDLLSENFNKAQLLLTIFALGMGIFLTRPMVKGKVLSARWK